MSRYRIIRRRKADLVDPAPTPPTPRTEDEIADDIVTTLTDETQSATD